MPVVLDSLDPLSPACAGQPMATFDLVLELTLPAELLGHSIIKYLYSKRTIQHSIFNAAKRLCTLQILMSPINGWQAHTPTNMPHRHTSQGG
jgi:hypothetical protein